MQEQHELRKQQMAQFLQKVKQSPNASPNPESPVPKQETPPPTKPSNSGVSAKKVGPAVKSSPTRPKMPDQASPNAAKSAPGNRRPSPSPRSRQSPLPNAESGGQSTPPNKAKKPEESNAEKMDSMVFFLLFIFLGSIF